MQKQWNAYNLQDSPACTASNHDLVISFTQRVCSKLSNEVLHDHLWNTLAQTKQPRNLITS